MQLRNTDLLSGEDEREAQRLVDAIVAIHNSCRERGATPAEFVALLNNWTAMYDQVAEKLDTELGHLQGDSAAQMGYRPSLYGGPSHCVAVCLVSCAVFCVVVCPQDEGVIGKNQIRAHRSTTLLLGLTLMTSAG